MSKKLILISIISVFISNTDAFFDGIYDALNCWNPLHSSASTSLRAIEPKQSSKKLITQKKGFGEVPEIRDDVSLQKAILQLRLKAAKRFIQDRTELLKHIALENWEINPTLLDAKRKDLENANSDVLILQEALENPSESNGLILQAN